MRGIPRMREIWAIATQRKGANLDIRMRATKIHRKSPRQNQLGIGIECRVAPPKSVEWPLLQYLH